MLIQTKILKNALSKIIGLIPVKPSIPILDNVVLKCKGNFMGISGTDLELYGNAVIPVEGAKDEHFCLNAKRLYDTVKMIEDDEIVITLSDKFKLTIITSKGEYKLTAENPNDFPLMPDEKRLEALPNFLDKAKKVVYACSQDDLRPAMTGVLISEDVIATDGHVLSFCSLIEGQKDEDLSLLKGTNILVPQKVLNLVLKSASENAGIFANEKYIRFDFKNSDFKYTIFSKLINETYPNYKAVIPSDYTNRVWINRTEFLNSLKRLIIFSNSIGHQTRITLPNKLEIKSIDSENGAEANETLEIKSETDGIPTDIGFNAEFVIRTLQSMTDEEIMIEYDTPTRAVIFEEKEHKSIIMPVRLN